MICIIDYGMGNIGSIENMLSHIGVESIISSKQQDIESAKGLILPGVGAFDKGMEHIEALKLDVILENSVIKGGKPILGICLGMQLFGLDSKEGQRKGLGWINGTSHHFDFELDSNLKVPHMGWGYVESRQQSNLAEGLHDQTRFYFVHSYYFICEETKDVLFTTKYGFDFTSGVQKENVFGVQFHPEKSHHFGMKMFENFVRICGV